MRGLGTPADVRRARLAAALAVLGGSAAGAAAGSSGLDPWLASALDGLHAALAAMLLAAGWRLWRRTQGFEGARLWARSASA